MGTHIGKIGRLPETVRQELNQRLADGEPAATVLAWVNALPMVRSALATRFESHAITEMNLSNWRAGGFKLWQKGRARQAIVREFSEALGDLEVTPKAEESGAEISKYVSRVFAADFAAAAQEAVEAATDPVERCARIQEYLRTLAQLRREEYWAGRLKIDRERRNEELTKARSKSESRKESEALYRQILGDHAGARFAETDSLNQSLALDKAEELLQSMTPPAGPADGPPA